MKSAVYKTKLGIYTENCGYGFCMGHDDIYIKF